MSPMTLLCNVTGHRHGLEESENMGEGKHPPKE